MDTRPSAASRLTLMALLAIGNLTAQEHLTDVVETRWSFDKEGHLLITSLADEVKTKDYRIFGALVHESYVTSERLDSRRCTISG